MKVESKYRNPDKFIRRLQAQLKTWRRIASDQREEAIQAHGKHICNVENMAEEKTIALYGKKLDELQPDDRLAIIVKVTTVSKYKNEAGVRCSSVRWACAGQEMRLLKP